MCTYRQICLLTPCSFLPLLLLIGKFTLTERAAGCVKFLTTEGRTGKTGRSRMGQLNEQKYPTVVTRNEIQHPPDS